MSLVVLVAPVAIAQFTTEFYMLRQQQRHQLIGGQELELLVALTAPELALLGVGALHLRVVLQAGLALGCVADGTLEDVRGRSHIQADHAVVVVGFEAESRICVKICLR